MKLRYIFSTLSLVLCVIIKANTYTPTVNWPYLNEDFKPGVIYLANGTHAESPMLNIHLEGHSLQCVNNNGIISKVTFRNIDHFTIGDKKYRPVEGRIMQSLHECGDCYLLYDVRADFDEMLRLDSPYGMLSSTSESMNVLTLGLKGVSNEKYDDLRAVYYDGARIPLIESFVFVIDDILYQGRYTDANVRVDAQLGYSYKPYGANTFYGAASTDQWESNERLMAALKAETVIGRLHLAPQTYWNRWNDHYQWHRGVSPGGENFHQVDVYGVGINSWLEWAMGKTAFGVEMRSDAIWSTSLGRPLDERDYRPTAGHDANADRQYTRYDQRTNASAYLEHDILLDQWTFSLGVLANHNTGLDQRWRLYPGVDIAYRPSQSWKLFASWNMALRMPTYTDLYYSGKGIEGNSSLSPEKTNDVSLGAKFRTQGWDIQAETFHSHKTDMIDWVVFADETIGGDGKPTDPQTWIYRSGNFSLNNVGVEMQAAWLPQEMLSQRCPLRRLSLSYSYIYEDITYDRPIVLSKYAQEYLRHKVVANADGTLLSYGNYKAGVQGGRITLSLSYRWQDRVGEGNDSYALMDGRLSWDMPRLRAYIDCTNILNKKYFDYSFVPQPGRWIKAGVVLKL